MNRNNAPKILYNHKKNNLCLLYNRGYFERGSNIFCNEGRWSIQLMILPAKNSIEKPQTNKNTAIDKSKFNSLIQSIFSRTLTTIINTQSISCVVTCCDGHIRKRLAVRVMIIIHDAEIEIVNNYAT